MIVLNGFGRRAILFNLVYRADPGERKEPGFKQETKETVAPSSALSVVA
jgi:hypothetical protein